MTRIDIDAVTAALDALPKIYPLPRGVDGVMLADKVIAARAWGYSNGDTAQPMSPGTRLSICSITKQFTCQVMLATLGDPAKLDGQLAAFLPKFTGPMPTVKQLCGNQCQSAHKTNPSLCIEIRA